MDKILLPLLLLVTAAGLTFAYTKPAWDASTALRAQQDRIDVALADAQSLQERWDDLGSEFNRLPLEDMRRLRTILPDEVDAVRFLILLDDIAVRNDIEIVDGRWEEGELVTLEDASGSASADEVAEVGTVLGVFTGELELAGPYQGFRQFLRQVERDLAIKDVTALEVSSSQRDSSRPGTESDQFPVYSMTVNMYYLP